MAFRIPSISALALIASRIRNGGGVSAQPQDASANPRHSASFQAKQEIDPCQRELAGTCTALGDLDTALCSPCQLLSAALND